MINFRSYLNSLPFLEKSVLEYQSNFVMNQLLTPYPNPVITESTLIVLYHGYEGNLNVINHPASTPVGDSFLVAGRELGFNVTDPNGARPTGKTI